MTEAPFNGTTRRIVLWIVALLEGFVIFFGAQLALRIFAMRDQLNELQTEVAKIQVRQEQYATLMRSQLDDLQRQLDRMGKK